MIEHRRHTLASKMNKTKLRKRNRSEQTQGLSNIPTTRKKKSPEQTTRQNMTTSGTKLAGQKHTLTANVPLSTTSSGESVVYLGSYPRHNMYPTVDLTKIDSGEISNNKLHKQSCSNGSRSNRVEPSSQALRKLCDGKKVLEKCANSKNSRSSNNSSNVRSNKAHNKANNRCNVQTKRPILDKNANLSHNDSFVLDEILTMEQVSQNYADVCLEDIRLDPIPSFDRDISIEELMQIYDVAPTDVFE